MSLLVPSINTLSTGATTSYEAYLARKEQLLSNTQEENYIRLLNAPPRTVQSVSTSATSNQQLSNALSTTLNQTNSTSADGLSAETASTNNVDNSLSGSFLSALVAKFDVTNQIATRENTLRLL